MMIFLIVLALIFATGSLMWGLVAALFLFFLEDLFASLKK